MKLSRKLDFYKSTSHQTTEAQDASKIPPSLQAIRDHFAAEVLFAPAPILKINGQIAIPQNHKPLIDLSLLSRGQITQPVDAHACLFFDLETTGLAGGTGTYAFLIGFAYLREETIVCEQYFLPDYGREPELFKQLNKWFRQFEYFVSYNGKSYDMPLLRNRFRLNRQDTAFSETRHIDLVHYCRRIWKDSLPNCTLGTIESLLLDDVQRAGDIPGSLIPQAYFDFLTTGRIHDILRIITHNRQDLLSMPLILGQLGLLIDDVAKLPLDAQAIEHLARLASEMGNMDILMVLENLASERSYALEPLWRQRARALKKLDQLKEANLLWQRLEEHPQYFCEAGRELAMYCEHRQKDFKQALQYVERITHYLEMQAELGVKDLYDVWNDDFQKRRTRLLHKISKIRHLLHEEK